MDTIFDRYIRVRIPDESDFVATSLAWKLSAAGQTVSGTSARMHNASGMNSRILLATSRC